MQNEWILVVGGNYPTEYSDVWVMGRELKEPALAHYQYGAFQTIESLESGNSYKGDYYESIDKWAYATPPPGWTGGNL